jgi:predicted ester cyclase
MLHATVAGYIRILLPASMQDPANELRRIPLPRTPVNKPSVNVLQTGRWHYEFGWCHEHARRREACQWRRRTRPSSAASRRRWLKGNLDVIDELLSPDFVDRNLLPGQGPTREDFKRTNKEFLNAFSITSFTIEEQIAEGDTVVTKYRQSGVSRGEIAGLPPTGEEDTVEGIHIHRISGGKITEVWSTLDVVPVWENLTQEIRERERVEQELSLLPASQGGGRRLLRLLRPTRGSAGSNCRGRDGQGNASGISGGGYLQHA